MTDLDELLAGAHSVGIAGHVKPDGDAFGSCMGLYLFLKEYSRRSGPRQHQRLISSESSQIVKGPSLTSATFMSAPNSPVSTGTPEARHCATMYS